jgi:polyphosphate kinase
MFIDDVIKANMKNVFPGYEIVDCYSIKISRDADFSLENEDQKDIAERILRKVRKRKIGAVTRVQYDKDMPDYFLKYLCEAYEIEEEELLPSGRYLNLSDLMKLPNPVGDALKQEMPQPLRVPELESNNSVLRVLRKQDLLLHFPYQSFDYLLRFLLQASFDPKVLEIKVTQYRVAENSAVINSLISAAKNGKKVTVFVELKARFDEENNYLTSELMQQAGVKIIYSLPGLKVHAKLAYIRKRSNDPTDPIKGYAYLGTGNFNEKTARIYSDKGLLTSNKEFIRDIDEIFRVLEGKPYTHEFKHLLVTQFNMLPGIHGMIEREIENVKQGGDGYIVLKMNSLEDKGMINALYRASEAGVKIDLIIRGICCLIPNQPYSRNITLTRIVDAYLEHARVWYFLNGGDEKVYLTSADWMERNLHRRIEVAFPIYKESIKRQIIDILKIQLEDNQSAVWVDEQLNNVFKYNDQPPLRAQQAIYEYLKRSTGQQI